MTKEFFVGQLLHLRRTTIVLHPDGDEQRTMFDAGSLGIIVAYSGLIADVLVDGHIHRWDSFSLSECVDLV